jgi:hypothetical protein
MLAYTDDTSTTIMLYHGVQDKCDLMLSALAALETSGYDAALQQLRPLLAAIENNMEGNNLSY